MLRHYAAEKFTGSGLPCLEVDAALTVEMGFLFVCIVCLLSFSKHLFCTTSMLGTL